MTTLTILFLVCAALGGTILVCQFVLTAIGLGGDLEVHDGGGGDMLHGDMGGHGGADFAGHTDVDGSGLHPDGGAAYETHANATSHASTHLLGMISFRTVVAALAFFGIAGLASQGAGLSPPVTVVIALTAGFGAMYGVYWVMRSLWLLQAEGTARVQGAVGKLGTVYLRVPGYNQGSGKIQINLQNRTMEYTAVTAGDAIPTGAKVVVVDVVSPDTVEVEPALEPERIENA